MDLINIRIPFSDQLFDIVTGIGIVIFYANISQSHFFIPIIYLLLHLLVLLLFNFPVSKCFLASFNLPIVLQTIPRL